MTRDEAAKLYATTLPPGALGHLFKSYIWRLVAQAADTLGS